MIPREIEEVVGEAVRTLAGFDAGERQWLRTKVLSHLAGTPDPRRVNIPSLVFRWAGFLTGLEQPIREGRLDAAIETAIALHGGLTREVSLFCRHLVQKAATSGKTDFNTIGDVADFILFAVIALEDGTTDLSLLHDMADYQASQVAHLLTRRGEAKPTEEEAAWLHGEIFVDFAKPELSPFEENQAAWRRNVARLTECLVLRRLRNRPD